MDASALRDTIRGLVGTKLSGGEDSRWDPEDPFWGGTRTTVATIYSPTLNRIWRLIIIGELQNPSSNMQLVEVMDGAASYADLETSPLTAFGHARSDLAIVVAAHALIDAVADLS